MMFIQNKKLLLGYSYIIISILFIILSIFAIIIPLYNKSKTLSLEYIDYNILLNRRDNLDELRNSKRILEYDFKNRDDIFLVKILNEGYVFFEQSLSGLVMKYNGNIMNSTRLTYKDINGISPIGYRILFRLRDNQLIAFFKELDKTMLKRAAIETIKLVPSNPERVNQEPLVDISIDFIMFCKKVDT